MKNLPKIALGAWAWGKKNIGAVPALCPCPLIVPGAAVNEKLPAEIS